MTKAKHEIYWIRLFVWGFMAAITGLWFVANPNLYFTTQDGAGTIRIGVVLQFAFALSFFNILSSWVDVNTATRAIGKVTVVDMEEGTPEEWGTVEDHFVFYTAALPWKFRLMLSTVALLFLPTGALIFNWAIGTVACLARG